MMNSLTFRPYQDIAHDAMKRFVTSESGHGILCASGASGKSLMIARDAEWLHENNQERVVVLADRAKLLEQNFSKFRNKNNVGIVSAGLGEFNYRAPIIVGGIQTLYNKIHLLGNVDKILVDECNAVGNNFEADTRYHQFIKAYPLARMLGYTATPFTLQEGQLNWGKIYHKITYAELLKLGYVVPLVNKIKDEPELDNIQHSGKEYNLEALAEYMALPERVKKTAIDIAANVKADGRKKGLVFCVNRKHAEEVTLALIHAGIRADLLTGDMPEWQRQEKYERFERNDINCLVNIEIATTGLDFPFIDWLACLRPTESLSLWHQILYRGVRLSPATNKIDCLLLDYSGNLKNHGGLLSQTWEYLGSTKKKIGKSIKTCPACEQAIPSGHEACPECGYIFEKEVVERELKHNMVADMRSDLNTTNPMQKIWEVGRVLYTHHTSQKGGEFLRAEYQAKNSNKSVSEYIPFGGSAYWQKKKCMEFVRKRDSDLLPESIKEALELCTKWKKPSLIKVQPQKDNPKYMELVEVLKWV